MKTKKSGLSWKRKLIFITVIAVLVLVLLVGGLYFGGQVRASRQPPEIDVKTVLEKMVTISELSTYESVYSGIAAVYDTKKPEEVDFYVSYDASVKAGIAFDEIWFDPLDTEQKLLTIHLPAVKLQEIKVDTVETDFIIYDEKANTIANNAVAYAACERDAHQEIKDQKMILDMARDNAENIVRALTEPILKQYDPEYQIIFAEEAAV